MDIPYDKTNESAYKYQEVVNDRIIDICNPLTKYFGIKLFGYTRVFFDGGYFFSCNNLDFLKLVLHHALKDTDVSNMTVNTPIRCRSTSQTLTSLLWSEMPSSQTGQLVYDYGFWHGFNFARILPDYTEIWTFMGDKESSELDILYRDNQKALLKFVHFFNASASDIISCEAPYKGKLGFYKNANNLPRELPGCKGNIAVNSFLEELHKKSKYLHKIKPELTYLTPREQECLSFLARGDTAKEVARNLEISPRTVETHLKAIKGKTGFHSRSQLIKFFLNHFT